MVSGATVSPITTLGETIRDPPPAKSAATVFIFEQSVRDGFAVPNSVTPALLITQAEFEPRNPYHESLHAFDMEHNAPGGPIGASNPSEEGVMSYVTEFQNPNANANDDVLRLTRSQIEWLSSQAKPE
jgi:hypothetical protein